MAQHSAQNHQETFDVSRGIVTMNGNSHAPRCGHDMDIAFMQLALDRVDIGVTEGHDAG
jgi:hypothetical protein